MRPSCQYPRLVTPIRLMDEPVWDRYVSKNDNRAEGASTCQHPRP